MAAPRMWYFRSEPTEHSVMEDSIPPEPELLRAFKLSLSAEEARRGGTRVSLDSYLPCVKELQVVDTRVRIITLYVRESKI